MNPLSHIAQQQSEFDLERFAEVANALLPQFLPAHAMGNRGQEPVNPRLVRYYTSQGLLDKPLKRGREARYIYRHLLQLLVVRRLLAGGYSASSIAHLTQGQTNDQLETLLQGGVQLTVEAANPALAFLSQIQARHGGSTAQWKDSQVGAASKASEPLSSSSPAPVAEGCQPLSTPPKTWVRLPLIEGLEVHIREDCVLPATAHERASLLQILEDQLTHLHSLRSQS